MKRTALALSLAVFMAGAHAQEAIDTDTQRNANQQERIEQGLQSGELSTKEAGRLEREETRVEKTEARDLHGGGSLTPQEKAQITREQNRVSGDIYREKHNAVTGNPNSASSQRMQADVQRNVNQQERINQGIQSGQLTNREVGKAERGQAYVTHSEANAAANGHVGAGEQAVIQGKENNQSTNIHQKKRNEKVRGDGGG